MFFLQSKGGLKMPKREDINTVLVIGSGPIIIGQACEFDYSGTQACKALRGLGYKIVLVNSNPATIMTDPETADVTYIEPLNVERLTQIIEKERPDALLPNLGGQSALNLCSELSNAGVLDEYNVQVLGVKVDAIERGEDRLEFKKAMNELGVTGMTCTQVMGCGVQKGAGEKYRGVEMDVTVLPKVKVEVIVGNIPVEKVIETASKTLYTGHVGDGKIFVYNVQKVVKVRTGEEDLEALKDVE